MKELNAQKTQLLINYLHENIDRNLEEAMDYEISGKYQHALVASARASDLKCVLSYLLKLMDNE